MAHLERRERLIGPRWYVRVREGDVRRAIGPFMTEAEAMQCMREVEPRETRSLRGGPLHARIIEGSERAPGGCLLWRGYADRHGYGRISTPGIPEGNRYNRQSLVHRESYGLFVGPLVPGLTIDHLCHTRDPLCEGGVTCRHRRCVEPSHLEQVTAEENLRRRHERLVVSR